MNSNFLRFHEKQNHSIAKNFSCLPHEIWSFLFVKAKFVLNGNFYLINLNAAAETIQRGKNCLNMVKVALSQKILEEF